MGPPSPPPENLSDISYNIETWYSYTLPTVDPKNILNHMANLFISAEISILSPEISNFAIYQGMRI